MHNRKIAFKLSENAIQFNAFQALQYHLTDLINNTKEN